MRTRGPHGAACQSNLLQKAITVDFLVAFCVLDDFMAGVGEKIFLLAKYFVFASMALIVIVYQKYLHNVE